jgi:uncharacterized protein YjaG (DUF416 family)
MRNLQIFEKKISQKLRNAAEPERILLGLNICKRLAADYQAFVNKNKWGDSRAIGDSIEFVEKFLNSSSPDKIKLESLINEIEAIIPDTEAFYENDVSYALNASVCVYELLMYLKDKDYTHILTISKLMTDSIDFKIQENNNNISEAEIDNHPMLITEINYQLELFS